MSKCARENSRRVLVFAAALGLSVSTAVLRADSAAADTLLPFTAVLNGAQETPPVPSPSTGVAFLTFNKTNSDLCYAISYTPLGGTETVAHFHLAPPGQPGPIVKDITPSPSPLGSPKNGCVTLDKKQVKDLNRGLFYINVHSSIAPGGEIRGQVLAVKGTKYKAPAISSPSGAFLD